MLNTFLDNPCFNNPCLNGATCQTSGSSYVCICPVGYSGTNCQTCKKKQNQLRFLILLVNNLIFN